jgi:macrolide transport system ATP-binding/permease protein
MHLADIFRLRFRSLFFRKTIDRELDEELPYHLERQIDADIAAGMTPQDARFAALRSIKDIEQRKEECRDMRGLTMIDNAVQDFRYATRQLRKNPGFACTAIFVLALGISAAVAIFGFVDAALIKPLPYRDQARLVAVFTASPGDARSIVSYLDFTDWKARNAVFSSIDAYALNGGFTRKTGGGMEQVPGTRVSAGFFHTLGVIPVLGRAFREGEDALGAARTVVLSYAAWQKRFGGKRDVLGQTVTLNGAPNIIIGVLPPHFHFAPQGKAEFWATLRSTDACEQQRGCHNLITIARLKDGVTLGAASANMQSIVRQLRNQYPDSNRDFGSASLVPLRDVIVGNVRPLLLALLSGAGLLLLIACVNVVTLLLARSDKRQREIAVRGALGASSSRLFHQFATEGLTLASAAGLFGLALAGWSMRFLAGLIPADKMASMPYLYGLGLRLPTIALGCSISLLAGALFSIVPMARLSRPAMTGGLKENARGYAGTTWRRFGSKLVVVEVAIAMVLMVSAGLLGKSLYLLLHVDTGFRPDHLALLQTTWPLANYATDRQKIALERQVVDRISALPGVRSAAISLATPVGSVWGTTSFQVVGRPNHGEHNEVLHRQVSAGYFATLEARLSHGRYFREAEDASQPLVAIINRTLANKYFPGEDPIGKQIYYDWRPQSPMQIAGVVDDIKEGPLEGATWPTLYVPFDQNPVAWFAILVRTSQADASLLPDMISAVRRIDPLIAISGGETMTEKIDQSPSAYLHRSAAWLVGTFAVAAFLLSVVGLYGVVAYSVAQRTREIGVRMALGAERGTVYQLILREAGRLTAFGLILGLVCSLTAAALLRSLLFGVHSWDAPTLIGVAAVLGVSALLASYIPARRAASVNPVEALRTE